MLPLCYRLVPPASGPPSGADLGTDRKIVSATVGTCRHQVQLLFFVCLSCTNYTYAMSHTLNGRDSMVVDESEVDHLVELGMDLISAILDKFPLEVVKSKVDAGAPLWFQDDDGFSALHAAAMNEDEELIQYLIAEGAVWNAGW